MFVHWLTNNSKSKSTSTKYKMRCLCPQQILSDVLYNWICQFKIVTLMYEEEIHFGNFYLNNRKWFWNI